MADYRETAKKYIKAGFSVIPVNSRKNPTVKKWGIWQTRVMNDDEIEKHFKNSWGIALLCGGKWGVLGVDIDLKYDLSNTLYDRYKELVPNSLLKKMYVQTTMKGGYHFLFLSPPSKLVGNKVLAVRGTTAYERDETYREAFADIETRDKATKIAANDKIKVLIETRSGTPKAAGGYVVISPSPGYKRIFGKIQQISEDECDILLEAARKLNEVTFLQEKDKNHKFAEEDWEINPFDDYNDNADIVQLLIDNGWVNIYETPRSVRFLRPGQVHSDSSALFDKNTKIFNVFSTSTSFETGKGYNPTSVLAELEYENNMSLTFKNIIAMGYGKESK